MYDPVIGLFVTADIIVQNFSNPQTLNRYAYCGNNPLGYVDPDGHGFWAALAALGSLISVKAIVIGAVVGAGISAATGGDIAMGALTGAITGAFFGGAGGIIANSIQAAANAAQISFQAAQTAGMGMGTAGRVALHIAAGTAGGAASAAATGGDVGMGALTGGLSAGAGQFVGLNMPQFANPVGNFSAQLGGRSIAGGITGGIAAEVSGGKFMDGFVSGAKTGAYGYFCNEILTLVAIAVAAKVITIGAVWLSSKGLQAGVNQISGKPVSDGQNEIDKACTLALAPSLSPLAIVAAPEISYAGYSYLLANPYTANIAAEEFLSGATPTPPPSRHLMGLVGAAGRRTYDEIADKK